MSFQALILAGAVVAAGRPRLYRLRDIALALILGAATSLLFWKGTLGFAASQIHTWRRPVRSFGGDSSTPISSAWIRSSTRRSWNTFANALSRRAAPTSFLFRLHGALLMTGVSGVLGAYFLDSSQFAPYQCTRCRKGCFAVPALL